MVFLNSAVSFRMAGISSVEGCYHMANDCRKQSRRCLKFLDEILRTSVLNNVDTTELQSQQREEMTFEVDDFR